MPNAVGMTAQGENQGTHWVRHACPLFRPLVVRKTYPRCSAFQGRLRVGLLRVALFDVVAGAHAVGVGATGGLHGSRARTKFLGDGPVAVLVADVVALEHGAALVLASGVGFWQCVVLFDRVLKQDQHLPSHLDPELRDVHGAIRAQDFRPTRLPCRRHEELHGGGPTRATGRATQAFTKSLAWILSHCFCRAGVQGMRGKSWQGVSSADVSTSGVMPSSLSL
jgi:hypothetical protein